MRYFMFISLLTLAVATMTAARAERLYYTGSITKTMAIQMDLRFEKGKVSGDYFYLRQNDKLSLIGTLDEQGKARLKEFTSEGRQTGYFNGVFDKQRRTFTGEWTRADKTHPLTFTLQAVAQHQVSNRKKGKVEMASSYPRLFARSAGNSAFHADITAEIGGIEKNFLEASRDPDADLEYGWQQDLDYDIAYYSPTLVSLRVTEYANSGGAHPNINIYGYNRLITDKGISKIELTDLFKPKTAFLKPLYAYLIKGINEEKKKRDGKDIDKLSMDEIASFTIHPCGINFIFPPYAVGSYAEGTYEIFVPFTTEGLSDLFTREGVIGEMVRKGSCR